VPGMATESFLFEFIMAAPFNTSERQYAKGVSRRG
jgi:hypothetical protein